MATNRVSPKKGKVVDIPTAPTVGTATAGAESATVAYTASTKGGPATTFTALSNPGSITGTGTSPITVSGLTAGTAYTFTVRGNNATGSGEYSSASNSITALVSSAYESIATVVAGSGGISAATFSSIPSTYKHLQIRGIAKGLNGSNNASLGVRVNGASDANQSPFHQLFADGATVSGSGGAAADGYTASLTGPIAASTQTAFGAFVIDIFDYQNTNKLKTIRSLAAADFNGSGFVSFRSTMNKNITAAITSLSITTYNSGGADGLAQYSSFALYGIKG
jgi:hypothetical protein